MTAQPKSTEPTVHNEAVILRFDSAANSLVAAKKAAYKFAKQCSFDFKSEGSNFLVTIHFFDDVPGNERARLVGAFKNEIIDQELREIIAEKTEPVRTLILAHAFSKTTLLHND